MTGAGKEPHQHCEHECVCWRYHSYDEQRYLDEELCGGIGCEFDTRTSHSSASQQSAEQDDGDVLYPPVLRENRIKIQSIAAFLMNKPQKITRSDNPSYILNHIGKAISYLMRNDTDGDIEYTALKNRIAELRQQAKEREQG